MAMSALIIEGGFMNKIVAMVSSHNATAERQYRYPVEYGVQKKIPQLLRQQEQSLPY